MKFSVEEAFKVLQNTPLVLKTLFSNISEEWIINNEGTNTWSPYEILAHLIVSEKNIWMYRAKTIIESNEEVIFKMSSSSPKDYDNYGSPILHVLDEFKKIRKENMEILKSYDLNEELLVKKAIHPSMGQVTLKQLLSAWVVHDLNHTKQIARVMAKQYVNEMGPWVEHIIVK